VQQSAALLRSFLQTRADSLTNVKADLANDIPLFAAANHISKDDDTEGVTRWLEFCIDQALSRKEIAAEEEKAIRDSNVAFCGKISSAIVKSLIERLAIADQHTYADLVVRQTSAWRDTLTNDIDVLQHNPLFPCFKEPLTQEQQNSVIREATKDVPVLTRTDVLMALQSEVVSTNLARYLKQQRCGLLFFAAESQLRNSARHNRLFGESSYMARCTWNIRWPIALRLAPSAVTTRASNTTTNSDHVEQ
jgi:hypothetical protein